MAGARAPLAVSAPWGNPSELQRQGRHVMAASSWEIGCGTLGIHLETAFEEIGGPWLQSGASTERVRP